MEQNPLIEVGLPICLVVIMTCMGLTLSFGDFRRVLFTRCSHRRNGGEERADRRGNG